MAVLARLLMQTLDADVGSGGARRELHHAAARRTSARRGPRHPSVARRWSRSPITSPAASAIFENQAFERRLRDIHAVTQQVQSQFVNFEVAGQVLLGLPSHVEADLMLGDVRQEQIASPAGAYDPSTHRMLSFHDAAAKFRDGTDTPRAYLERCIERIEALEPAVMAFAFLNLERARKAADEVRRALQGRPAARAPSTACRSASRT